MEDCKGINALLNSLPSSAENKHDPSNSGDKRSSATKDTSTARAGLQNCTREDLDSVLPAIDVTLRGKEAEEKRMLEWRLVAKVFDRLFLILFSVCFLISSIILLSGCSEL